MLYKYLMKTHEQTIANPVNTSMTTADELGLDINTSILGVTSSKRFIHDIPECFTTNDVAELRKGEFKFAFTILRDARKDASKVK